MKSLKLLTIILSIILISGCAMMPTKPPANPNNPIKRIAILPIKNDTTDVGGPNFVRGKLLKAFEYRYYNVKPVEETDRLLRDRMGITLGGQLEMAKIEKLREVLDVEGLVFGTLMDFGETTTGVYNVRKVRGKFKLVNALTNETFWANGIGVKSEESAGKFLGTATALAAGIKDKDAEVPWVTIQSQHSDKSVFEGLAAGLGKKLVSKITKTHLLRETNEMIRRILENLPWGPGSVTVASAPVKFQIPKVKMPPPPSVGHLDYGKRDFSAVIVSNMVDKKGKDSFAFKMPIAKAGKKIRLEVDYSNMSKGGQMPPALSKMVTIHRGDKKITYSLYPGKKRYIVHNVTDENYFEKPKVIKTKVGSETIDGHPTEKFKIKITYKNAKTQQGYIWNATDLDGLTIKSEIEDETMKYTSQFKNIVLKTPSKNLFVIPTGFTEANGFMELMVDEK